MQAAGRVAHHHTDANTDSGGAEKSDDHKPTPFPCALWHRERLTHAGVSRPMIHTKMQLKRVTCHSQCGSEGLINTAPILAAPIAKTCRGNQDAGNQDSWASAVK
jgi:hypothetical protein